MKRILGLALATLALTGTIVGCSGGEDEAGSGGSISSDNYGGLIVLLAGGAAGGYALAEFYSAVTPLGQTIEIPGPSNECELDVDDNYTFTYEDVGSSVTFASGAATLTAVESTGGGAIYYATPGVVAGNYPTNADYEIAVTGGASIGTLYVPNPVTLDGSPTTVAGQPLDITYSINTGADVIYIGVENAAGTVSYSCYSSDDGAFTIPAEVTTDVGAGADIFVVAQNYEIFTLGNGREVLAVSQAL